MGIGVRCLSNLLAFFWCGATVVDSGILLCDDCLLGHSWSYVKRLAWL
jgi:hypothetical protein